MVNNFKTAEELMRARYNAFETGNIEFIVDTHHPDSKSDMDVEETKKWALNSEWLGLEIVSTEGGKEEDSEGIVEFKAFYKENGQDVVHHEKSQFLKVDGQWMYFGWLPLQGTIVKEEKIGRNDPCLCGSGKKFKKCCGK
ncbi:MAG: YchJ family protein [Cetobacterium sp.]|uniref:YchJ family protein n=1 Tax=unclassified Cetobacterium TaxID=2630983 RepID=UPI000646B4B9|nr:MULTISPECIES: YchJ family metal-binding protein [unclassified Cetobacterium]